jgi:hypothetical protein
MFKKIIFSFVLLFAIGANIVFCDSIRDRRERRFDSDRRPMPVRLVDVASREGLPVAADRISLIRQTLNAIYLFPNFDWEIFCESHDNLNHLISHLMRDETSVGGRVSSDDLGLLSDVDLRNVRLYLQEDLETYSVELVRRGHRNRFR